MTYLFLIVSGVHGSLASTMPQRKVGYTCRIEFFSADVQYLTGSELGANLVNPGMRLHNTAFLPSLRAMQSILRKAVLDPPGIIRLRDSPGMNDTVAEQAQGNLSRQTPVGMNASAEFDALGENEYHNQAGA